MSIDKAHKLYTYFLCMLYTFNKCILFSQNTCSKCMNMIKYKIDVLEELKGKGYTSYKLRKDKIMGEAQIQKIRQGEIASKETLNTICKLLQIQPGDLLEYIDD